MLNLIFLTRRDPISSRLNEQPAYKGSKHHLNRRGLVPTDGKSPEPQSLYSG